MVGADIVVEATRLERPEPILRTEWLEQCTLLIPYGTMSVLELDVLDAFDKVVVDDWGQCGRDDAFGALRPQVRAGRLTAESLHAELGQIVAGRRPGRVERRRADRVLASRSRDDRCRSRVACRRARARRGHRDGPEVPLVSELAETG